MPHKEPIDHAPLSVDEMRRIEKREAKIIRRASREEQRKLAQEAIDRNDARIQEIDERKHRPDLVDLTLTPDPEPIKLELLVDLTKPPMEDDPLWKDLEAQGMILMELINTTAAWKHRACLTEAATVTMINEHSLPRSRLAKFLTYIRKEK